MTIGKGTILALAGLAFAGAGCGAAEAAQLVEAAGPSK